MAQVRAHVEGQQHPIKLYLVVWGWLFVLSTCSFLVDYFELQGYLRWFLILLFMIVKAGLIVAIFMHMAWERLALTYAILVPPGAAVCGDHGVRVGLHALYSGRILRNGGCERAD
jgi:cytochrome c oxidase subunit IV